MLGQTIVSPGLLFGSFLYRKDLHSPEDLKAKWESCHGESFYFVPKLNPLFNYYASEMGEVELLDRFFALSTQPFPRDQFLQAKLSALQWETEWSDLGQRRVNVDTGMLTAENFTLATTKNYAHRIFVGHNVFSDLTYQVQHGKLCPLPWTYPDYLDEEKMEFFIWGRSYLLTKTTQSRA